MVVLGGGAFSYERGIPVYPILDSFNTVSTGCLRLVTLHNTYNLSKTLVVNLKHFAHLDIEALSQFSAQEFMDHKVPTISHSFMTCVTPSRPSIPRFIVVY